ncbi:copper chaperone [Candidatus Woesearchaeota archaeon]|nr:MAG: copper chaperone [Candidatus Woesearchaeota archaeon]
MVRNAKKGGVFGLGAIMLLFLLLAGCSTTEQVVDEGVAQRPGVALANVREATLQVEGMTCSSCALGVEYQLKQVEGVIEAKIDYEEGGGFVRYDADRVALETIVSASDVYPVSVVEDGRVTS